MIEAASHGIINGSAIVFATMFLAAIVLGRAWCGWACPGAGLMEALFDIQPKPFRSGKLDRMKWFLWVPWIAGIAFVFAADGAIRDVQPLFMIDSGISIHHPMQFATYYSVVALFLVPSLLFGRRAGCHLLCWMSPFMILGSRLSRGLGLIRLRLIASPERCRQCRECAARCPMSLDVPRLVTSGRMDHDECILCGTCADTCLRDVIQLRFAKPSGRGM